MVEAAPRNLIHQAASQSQRSESISPPLFSTENQAPTQDVLSMAEQARGFSGQSVGREVSLRPRVNGAINSWDLESNEQTIRFTYKDEKGEGFLTPEISVEEWNRKTEAEKLLFKTGKATNSGGDVTAGA